jgi:hypothetical protein
MKFLLILALCAGCADARVAERELEPQDSVRADPSAPPTSRPTPLVPKPDTV